MEHLIGDNFSQNGLVLEPLIGDKFCPIEKLLIISSILHFLVSLTLKMV